MAFNFGQIERCGLEEYIFGGTYSRGFFVENLIWEMSQLTLAQQCWQVQYLFFAHFL
jgi:hypothetical protein